MFRWQLLDQVNVGGEKCYVRQVAGSPKDQTGRVDPFKHQYALTVLLGGDAGLALNFWGNEHVPPSSHTDLWPDNCTDSRLLGLNLSGVKFVISSSQKGIVTFVLSKNDMGGFEKALYQVKEFFSR